MLCYICTAAVLSRLYVLLAVTFRHCGAMCSSVACGILTRVVEHVFGPVGIACQYSTNTGVSRKGTGRQLTVARLSSLLQLCLRSDGPQHARQ